MPIIIFIMGVLLLFMAISFISDKRNLSVDALKYLITMLAALYLITFSFTLTSCTFAENLITPSESDEELISSDCSRSCPGNTLEINVDIPKDLF